MGTEEDYVLNIAQVKYMRKLNSCIILAFNDDIQSVSSYNMILSFQLNSIMTTQLNWWYLIPVCVCMCNSPVPSTSHQHRREPHWISPYRHHFHGPYCSRGKKLFWNGLSWMAVIHSASQRLTAGTGRGLGEWDVVDNPLESMLHSISG